MHDPDNLFYLYKYISSSIWSISTFLHICLIYPCSLSFTISCVLHLRSIIILCQQIFFSRFIISFNFKLFPPLSWAFLQELLCVYCQSTDCCHVLLASSTAWLIADGWVSTTYYVYARLPHGRNSIILLEQRGLPRRQLLWLLSKLTARHSLCPLPLISTPLPGYSFPLPLQVGSKPQPKGKDARRMAKMR